MSDRAPTPPVAGDAFRQAMRRLAAGVTIVTTAHEGERHGLTATAVCSLSADPPQLLVCVHREAAAHEPIRKGGRLCVNVLARGQHRLAGRFAGQVQGARRFGAGRWIQLATGAPVLADALASFDCEVTERVSSTTHTIFIGRVVGVRVRENGKPLLYASGSYAGLESLATGRRRRVSAAPPRRGRR